MDEITISSAEIAFAAAMALITISSAVLNSAWKTLRLMVSSLPNDRQRVRWDLRAIEDEREKDKASIIMVQFFGCLCFIASIAFSVFAIGGVMSVMLGYDMGFYQQQNYEFGEGCLLASGISFVIGFVVLGFTYIDKVNAITTGRPEIATTPLENLPPLPAHTIARRRRLDRLIMIWFPVCIIVLSAIQVVNPFGTWINVLLSIVALVLIWLLTIAIMWVVNRIRAWVLNRRRR